MAPILAASTTALGAAATVGVAVGYQPGSVFSQRLVAPLIIIAAGGIAWRLARRARYRTAAVVLGLPLPAHLLLALTLSRDRWIHLTTPFGVSIAPMPAQPLQRCSDILGVIAIGIGGVAAVILARRRPDPGDERGPSRTMPVGLLVLAAVAIGAAMSVDPLRDAATACRPAAIGVGVDGATVKSPSLDLFAALRAGARGRYELIALVMAVTVVVLTRTASRTAGPRAGAAQAGTAAALLVPSAVLVWDATWSLRGGRAPAFSLWPCPEGAILEITNRPLAGLSDSLDVGSLYLTTMMICLSTVYAVLHVVRALGGHRRRAESVA